MGLCSMMISAQKFSLELIFVPSLACLSLSYGSGQGQTKSPQAKAKLVQSQEVDGTCYSL